MTRIFISHSESDWQIVVPILGPGLNYRDRSSSRDQFPLDLQKLKALSDKGFSPILHYFTQILTQPRVAESVGTK